MRSLLTVAAVGFGGYLLLKRLSIVENAPKLSIESRFIRMGDQGADVEALQIALNYLGYPAGQVDGIFGEATQDALRSFQIDLQIANDGLAGPQTQAAIDEELRKRGGSFTYRGV